MRQMDRRTFVGGMAGVLAAPLMAGCVRTGSAPAEDNPDATADHTLRCQIDPPAAMDPALICDVGGMQVASQLFDAPMRFDAATGAALPLAVESCEMAADALSCTMHMRADATFHTGESVRAEHFKRAWERLVATPAGLAAALTAGAAGTSAESEGDEAASDGDGAADGSSAAAVAGDATAGAASCAEEDRDPNFAGLLAFVEGYDALRAGAAAELSGVTCPDELTLHIAFTEPCAVFPLVATHAALAPVSDTAFDDGKEPARPPIGNGPFMFDAQASTDRELRLTRFDSYCGDAVRLESVVLELDRDVAAAYRRLETGRLDACSVPVDQLEAAADTFGVAEGDRTSPGTAMLRMQGLSMQYVVCNIASTALESVPVRRALSLAIDRDTLCEKALRQAFEPATGPVPEALATGAVAPWSWCAYDAETAAELLEPLYPADEDGARDLSLTLVCSKRGVDAKIADTLVSDFKALGIALHSEALDRDALRKRLRDGDFDLACLGWTPAYPDLFAIAHPLLSSAAAGATNFSGYADAALDEAIASARSMVDTVARRARLGEAFAMAGEATPIIPLAVERQTLVAGERVERIGLDARGVVQLASAELA